MNVLDNKAARLAEILYLAALEQTRLFHSDLCNCPAMVYMPLFCFLQYEAVAVAAVHVVDQQAYMRYAAVMYLQKHERHVQLFQYDERGILRPEAAVSSGTISP